MADAETLRILGRGKEDWDSWRRSVPRPRLNLRGAVLPSSDFNDFDLSNCDLQRACLAESMLNGADLSLVVATEACFFHSTLAHARCGGLRAQRADFARSALIAANVLQGNL